MGEIWVSVQELIEMDVSAARIWRKCSRDREWVSRDEPPTGREGRPGKEVLLSSLPEDLQVGYLKRQASIANHRGMGLVGSNSLRCEACEVVVDDQGAEYCASCGEILERPEDKNRVAKIKAAPLLQKMQPEHRDAWIGYMNGLVGILRRYEAIQPKRKRDDRTGRIEWVQAVVELANETGCSDPIVLNREPHRAKPVSPRTLDRWLTEYKRGDGYATFLRAQTVVASDDKRKAELHPEFVGWYERNRIIKPSPKDLRELALIEAKKQGWGEIPSESWFYRRKLAPVVHAFHFNRKAFMDKFAMFVPRDYNDLGALQILCGDHSQRDVSVVLKSGLLARLWLTLWQCLRTGLIWGWHLDLVPSSYTIGRAYYNGVLAFGAQPFARPEDGYYSYLLHDWGKDYTSRHLSGKIEVHKLAARMDGRMEMIVVERQIGLISEMQIQRIQASPYNAREKMVERTHRDISEWEKNTFWQRGYRGCGTQSVPQQWRDMYKQHQKFEKGKRDESPFVSIEEYREQLGLWIVRYNSTEHKRTTLGGRTVVPIQEYERLYTTRYEIDEDSLRLLLLKSASATVGKNGIRVTGTPSNWWYYHPAMLELKGTGYKVEYLYDEADYASVEVILPDGAKVTAEKRGPASVLPGPINKQRLQEYAKERAEETKALKAGGKLRDARLRGETPEDRVDARHAAQEEFELEENEKVAVGQDRPSVRRITRMDRAKAAATSRPAGTTGARFKPATVEEIKNAEVDESIFAPRPVKKRI